MKYKTTQKAIKESYSKIVKVGYCNLQSLLNFKTPVAYTCGSDGWHADIYDINGVAIVTGYRPFGNITPDYKIVEKYNQLGKEIYEEEHNPSKDWNKEREEKENRLNQLIKQFIEEVTNQKEEQ